MNNVELAEYGRRAIKAGNQDHGQNDFLTSASDTLANILHAVNAAEGLDGVEHALSNAQMHFEAELDEESIQQEFEEGTGSSSPPDHRFNPAPFCAKCGGPCEMEED